MSSARSHISPENKVRVVEAYLTTGQSLRKISRRFAVPRSTLQSWVKLYKEGGQKNLVKKKVYRKRIPKDIETKVMFLKEQNPALCITRARQILKKQGIILSQKGIWQIWKRYGISKRPIDNPIHAFGIHTPESTDAIVRAKNLMGQKKFKETAEVFNSLPSLPDDPSIEILKEIPERLLSPRRRLDRLVLQFNEIPFPQFRNNASRVAKILEREGYIYSSIIANFMEVIALDWMGKHAQKASLLDLLSRKMAKMKDNTLWFYVYFHQTTIFCKSLQMSKGLEYVRKCRRLLCTLDSPHYLEQFGNLLTFPGKYREAAAFYEKALRRQKDHIKMARLNLKIANFGHNMAGEYKEAEHKFKHARAVKESVSFSSPFRLGQAYISFGQGNLSQASVYSLESLKKASTGELHNLIYATSVVLAAVSMAINKKQEAATFLKKYLPLMKKHRLLQEVTILRQLQGSKDIIPEDLLHAPLYCLLYLLVKATRTLKISDYRRAFHFAQKQRLLGLFHRWIVFFPMPVRHLLEKGKQTGLPKPILKFPLFNQSIPVYHTKFLGDVVIARNDHHIRSRLSPQEKTFLIHFSLRAGAPGKFMLLDDLYNNFWPKSAHPSDLLLHLLARLKKKLKVPSHLLRTSSTYQKQRLINHGVFFTTDYSEFETLLVQVKSLERADEWSFALKDYLRAFKLLRGAPFVKMYDHWSENMRRVILNKVENEALHCARECLARNNKTTARKVLKKAVTIIPYSQEVNRLLEERGS